MFRIKDYPREFWLKNEQWKLYFKNKIERGEKIATMGLYDPFEETIFVKRGQGPEETFISVVHELLHLGCDRYKFRLPHDDFDKLAQFIHDLLDSNL